MEECPYQCMKSKGKEKVHFYCMNGDTEAETLLIPMRFTTTEHLYYSYFCGKCYFSYFPIQIS